MRDTRYASCSRPPPSSLCTSYRTLSSPLSLSLSLSPVCIILSVLPFAECAIQRDRQVDNLRLVAMAATIPFKGMKHCAAKGSPSPSGAPRNRRDFGGPPALFQKCTALSIIYRTTSPAGLIDSPALITKERERERERERRFGARDRSA